MTWGAGVSMDGSCYTATCPVHGDSYHSKVTNKCVRCSTPKPNVSVKFDADAVARRRRIEDHQRKKEDWFED